MPEEFEILEMKDGKKIVFLTVGFLYAEELQFSRDHYQEGFIKEILRRGRLVDDFLVFDPSRRNLFSKKKPWWKLW